MDKMLFERFAQMAREQFGCTVVQVESTGETFETLYGIDLSDAFEFDVPYYYSEKILDETGGFEISDPANSLQFNEIFSDSFNLTSKMLLAA